MPMIPTFFSALISAVQAATPQPPATSQPPPSGDPADTRNDAWVNLESGMGIADVDKSASIAFVSGPRLGRHTLSALYRYDGIAAKIVEMPVKDSIREGWTVDVQGGGDSDAEPVDVALADEVSTLNLPGVYLEAAKWARLYGNAIVIAGLDDVDDGDLSGPVQGYGKLSWLEVVAAGYAGPVSIERNDPEDRSKITMYVVSPTGTELATRRIHPDRVHLVHGVELPAEIAARNNHWDDSILQRVWDALSKVATADGAGVTYLSERQYPVWKIKGLKNLLSSKAAGSVVARFQAMSKAKSIYKAILLDMGNEEYDVLQTSPAGISEMLKIYPDRVAAVSWIPMTRLYGTSPGGLNATGEGDEGVYYDFVRGEQTEHLVPFVEWVTTLVLEGLEGPTLGELLPFTVRLNPLWSPTQKEIADTKAVNASTDIAYITIGVLGVEEVRASRFGGNEYGDEIVLNEEPAATMGGLT